MPCSARIRTNSRAPPRSGRASLIVALDPGVVDQQCVVRPGLESRRRRRPIRRVELVVVPAAVAADDAGDLRDPGLDELAGERRRATWC